MISIRRLALVAIAATVVASPALAQSFDPDVGTGNIVPFRVGPATTTVQMNRVATHQVRRHIVTARRSGLSAFAAVPGNGGGSALAAPQSGLNAFGMVPGNAGGDAYDPALNGGASSGYNQFLKEEW